MIQSSRRPRPGCGRARATRRNAPCAYGARCIHGMGCWGVHLPSELAIFRQQQELTERVCGVCETEQRRDIPADIAEASAQISAIVGRVVDRWQRVRSDQEFFDAPLIPRRRKHRRLRKRQRAKSRQQRRLERDTPPQVQQSVAVQVDIVSQVETEDGADAETWRDGYRSLARQLDSERQRREELEENLEAEEEEDEE